MKVSRAAPTMSPDVANLRAMSPPAKPSCDLATVGYIDELTTLPDATPMWVRLEQGEMLVEITTSSGDEIMARIGASVQHIALEFGCQVVVIYPGGEEELATIVGRLHDLTRPVPALVAGVDTGAAGAVARGVHLPAPAWTFTRVPDGQLFAIETGPNGDYLLHSGGSVEIAVATPAAAIHLNGRVALGVAPLVPPLGAKVGPAGTTIPGVPATAYIDPPVANTPAPPQTIVPYVGTADGILRAKDDLQSTIVEDPYFWAWIAKVGAVPVVLAAAGPPPIALHSKAGGLTGPGSKHTASD